MEKWIIRNLRDYGNCYMFKLRNVNELEKILNKKIKVKTLTNGFILEVVKC